MTAKVHLRHFLERGGKIENRIKIKAGILPIVDITPTTNPI